MSKRKVAIIGSGNIGTDLMIKILRHGQHLEMAVMVGIDPQSDGLARARRMGVATTHEGVIGLMNMPEFADIDIVFDATSAGAHVKNDAALREAKPDIRLIDLTPAAIGPYCVPVVNLEANVDQLNVNMVTCGGQATIPMVAAVSRVARVHYAEIIASIASKSAGPGTRANIDEFTETTSRAIEVVGGAAKGKAIIVLNPAEPPLMMRDTVASRLLLLFPHCWRLPPVPARACRQSGAHGRFCSHNHTQSTQHGCCRSCHCLSLEYDGYLTLSFTHAQQFNNLPAIRDVV